MNLSENSVDLSINFNVNYLLTFLFILIGIIGILGNCLVIISVRSDIRMRRSLTNRLIVHVACCDLIILLLNLPDIIQFVSSTNGNWILSQLSCKVIRTILVLAQYASVLTMCAITIERFIGIVYPLRSKFLRKKKHVAQIRFIVWIFSLICVSPNVIYLRVIKSSSRSSCLLQYSLLNLSENQRGYIIHKSIESTIFYFIPLLLQIFCYAKIAKQLYYVDDSLQTSFHLIQKDKNEKTQDDLALDEDEDFIDNDEIMGSRYTIADSFVHSSNGNTNSLLGPVGNQLFQKSFPLQNNSPLSITKLGRRIENRCHPNINYKALKSRRSVIKMLSIVVLIYFVSFSPQVLTFILFDTNLIRRVPQFIQTPYFIACTMLLVTISSASNPIVYAIFCSKFRQSFAKILRRLWICKRSTLMCYTNQRTRSLQQIPRATYQFDGKMINGEKSEIVSNGICIHLNHINDE